MGRIGSMWAIAAVLAGGVAAEAVGQERDGLRGDPTAIEHAEAMVERMGGMDIWNTLECVHFVHDWD